MKRQLLNCVILLSLAASVAAAQQNARGWFRVVPEGEEFTAYFPEPHFRIRRELPFEGNVTLKPASFEVTNRGALLSVLSFSKAEPATPKKLDAFVKGFRYALAKGGVKSQSETETAARPSGKEAARLRLTAGEYTGAARVFETPSHFYVVLTLGGAQSAGTVEHFNNSFALGGAGAEGAPLNDTEGVGVLITQSNPPAPLWGVAGNKGTIGILVGDREAPEQHTGGGGGPDIGGKTVISGGVLNGKALSKPQPVYPPIAKAARAQGVVVVQIIVDEEGYVIAAAAVSGHPLLQQASVYAARQARFSPTLLEGQPVKVSGVISYNFVLQ